MEQQAAEEVYAQQHEAANALLRAGERGKGGDAVQHVNFLKLRPVCGPSSINQSVKQTQTILHLIVIIYLALKV